MNKIPIVRKKNNLEVVTKVMNSICVKYECSVKYDPADGTIRYSGDESLKPFIAQETLNLFQQN